MGVQVYGARVGAANSDGPEVGILVDTVTGIAFGPIFLQGPEDAEAFLCWLAEEAQERRDARKLAHNDLVTYAIAWEDEVSGDELRDRREAASDGLTYQAWCERRDRARAYDEAIEREEAEDRDSAQRR